MLREEGWVVALEGSYALVSSARGKACGTCHTKGACGAFAGGQNEVRVLALNTASARVGDRVVLALHEHLLVQASFLLYILPVLVLLAVLAVAQSLLDALAWGGGGQALAFLAGIGAMALTFLGLRKYNAHLEKQGRFRPTVVSVLLDSWSGCESG